MSKDDSPSPDGLIPKLAATIVAALGPLCRRLTLPSISPASQPSGLASTMSSPSESQRILPDRKAARRSSHRHGGFPAGKHRHLVDEEIEYPDLTNPEHQNLRPYLFASSTEPGSSSDPSALLPPPSISAILPIVLDEDMPKKTPPPDGSDSPLRNTAAVSSPLTTTAETSPPRRATAESRPPPPYTSLIADNSDSDGSIPTTADEDLPEVPPVSFADRAAAHRSLVADRDQDDPDFRRSSTKPHNPIYISAQAVKRYKHISKRKFITQKNFPLVPGNPNREVVQFFLESTGMTPTVLDMEPYVQEIVKEFYVRGHMFEFSPDLINKLYLIDSSRFDATKPVIQSASSEDDLAVLMSGARVTRWADLITKRFSRSMKMFHKICCYNWIPGTNRTTLRIDHVRLIDMVMDDKPFNFGKLVFEHALSLSKLGPNSTHRLAYPNLIYQVLTAQRDIRPLPSDTLSRSSGIFKLEASEVQDEALPAQTSRTLLRDDLADLLAVAARMKRRLDGKFLFSFICIS